MTEPGPTRAPQIAVAVIAALVVVVAAIVLPLVLAGDDEPSADSDRAATGAGGVDTTNLDLVQEYELPVHVHVRDEVDYPQAPPIGGDHWDPWLDCGVYDVPVQDEHAVHDLEHGSVWITYRPDLVDAAGVAELAGQLPDNGIMSPYPEQEAPVVITVWGRQLELVGPDDPRIPLFVAEYGAGATAPEPWGSCAGGTAEVGTSV